MYSVELRPGFRETSREVEAAYGGNLPGLRHLAQRYDPTGVFGSYAPLGPPQKGAGHIAQPRRRAIIRCG